MHELEMVELDDAELEKAADGVVGTVGTAAFEIVLGARPLVAAAAPSQVRLFDAATEFIGAALGVATG